MIKIKLFIAAVVVSSMLSFGAPVVSQTVDVTQMPPAVVFVQDRNDNMILRHNFVHDNRLLVPWDNGVDKGFWVK